MKKILFLLGILILGLAIFLAWFIPSAYIGSPASTSVPLSVPENSTASSMAELLSRKGMIISSLGYKIFSYLDVNARHPKSGDYAVYPGSSYRSLAKQFALGPSRDEIAIRILEGSNTQEINQEMAKWGVAVKEFTDLVGDSKTKKSFSPSLRPQFDFLKDLPTNASLEGYLFPDTYRVWKDQLPLGFVLKQLQEFKRQTDGYATEAKIQGRNLEDVVILASLVEKEGRTTEERKMIAGILLNRLKAPMRLQLDSTVNYATGGNKPRVSLEDLEVDSPYNTYKHDGLPPGPICNPGADSLDAALHPTSSQYYYYLHDDSGKIYYAKTIEEHKANRVKAYGK